MSQHPRPSARRPLALALAMAALASAFASSAVASAKELVYIDPGHGGPYRDSVYYGQTEKGLNLLVSQELRYALQSRGFRVGMTRYTDTAVCRHDIATWNWNDSTGWRYGADGITTYTLRNSGTTVPKDDLQARCNLANAAGADIFVSVHQNGGGGRGTETYAARRDTLGQRLSDYVQSRTVASAGTVNRGAKDADFYVTRWANMPAVLVECAFYDNYYDSALLRSLTGRRRIARGIANGIADFLATKPFARKWGRFAGADRFGTAAAASRFGWPSGAKAAILVPARTWPDAMSAAPLSRKLDAPVLLSEAGRLTSETAAELARLRPAEVVLVGGEGSLNASVAAEAALAASLPPASVRRIGGASRYHVAAGVSEAVVGTATGGPVVIASGDAFADGLTASAIAAKLRAPLLLANRYGLPAATAAHLAAHPPSSTIVVGGKATLPDAVVAGLPAITRIEGADRFAVNVAAIQRYWPSGTVSPIVADGIGFPDALVAGSLSGKTGRPLLLVKGRVLPDRTREWIQRTADAGRIGSFAIVGGTGPIPYLMDWMLEKAKD